ncbi:MAG: hypothetical protein PUC14_07325 [Bacteroidales bacterium]|nr:hypothetical protein [Bacteroidales bacterium]MDD5975513.1 hypothetical protein [Bacteroidales bacterium]MDY5193425.1 hypothetical protein [Candidatus Aphodosoma sp.]
MNRLAKIFSAIFHPVFLMTGFFFFEFIRIGIVYDCILVSSSVLYIILLFTTILPIMGMIVCRLFRVISSFEMKDKKERIIPYLISITSYIVLIILLYSKYNSPLTSGVLFIVTCSAVSLIFISIINFYWKISIHLCGAGALLVAYVSLGLLYGYYVFPFLVSSVAIAAVLGWARMQLESHTLSQVICGWLVGFVPAIIFLCCYIWL